MYTVIGETKNPPIYFLCHLIYLGGFFWLNELDLRLLFWDVLIYLVARERVRLKN